MLTEKVLISNNWGAKAHTIRTMRLGTLEK